MTTNTPYIDTLEALVMLVDESKIENVSAYDVLLQLIHRTRGGAVSATVILDGWVSLLSEAGAVIESLTEVEQDGPGWDATLQRLIEMASDLEANAND